MSRICKTSLTWSGSLYNAMSSEIALLMTAVVTCVLCPSNIETNGLILTLLAKLLNQSNELSFSTHPFSETAYAVSGWTFLFS